LVDSERVYAFVGRHKKMNSKCSLIEGGIWGRCPQPPEAKGSGAPALRDFYNFSLKITRF